MYWADKDIPPNDIRFIDTIPYYQPRRLYGNEAYGVEATAYALMTYVVENRRMESMPVVKWLETMRNSFAGQASTQVGRVLGWRDGWGCSHRWVPWRGEVSTENDVVLWKEVRSGAGWQH